MLPPVQFKEKYLAHLADCKAPDCINSSQEQTYKADLAWLYSLLNQPGKVVESHTKVWLQIINAKHF